MTVEHVTASMPGVFYRRPDPEEPPLVEVGDEVSEGDEVGLIGVMKSFHTITAPADGTVVDILVENESEIEAGEQLMELEVA